MKRGRHLSVAVCIMFFSVLFLAGVTKNVRGDQGTSIEEKSGEKSSDKKFSEEKKEFKQEMKQRLDVLDNKIKELEAELKKVGSKAKTESKEGLKELKNKRAELKKDMKKLGAKSRRKWDVVKGKVRDAMDDLEDAYNKVRDKFKTE